MQITSGQQIRFPLVMRKGQGGMRGYSLELADMCVALEAILDWDKRIDEVESEDEADITLTSQVPAVPGFRPALTIHTTLQDNPCLARGGRRGRRG